MELFFLQEPLIAGREVKLTLHAEPDQRISFITTIANDMLIKGDCADPPCHEMLYIPPDAAHKILSINAASTSE